MDWSDPKTKNSSLERMKQAKLHSIFFPNKFNSVPALKKGKDLNFKNKNCSETKSLKKLSPLP